MQVAKVTSDAHKYSGLAYDSHVKIVLPGRTENNGKRAVPLDLALCCPFYVTCTIMPLLQKDQEEMEYRLKEARF